MKGKKGFYILWVVVIVLIVAMFPAYKWMQQANEKKELERLEAIAGEFADKDADKQQIYNLLKDRVLAVADSDESFNGYNYCTAEMLLDHETMSADCATALDLFNCGIPKAEPAAPEKQVEPEEESFREPFNPELPPAMKELALLTVCQKRATPVQNSGGATTVIEMPKESSVPDNVLNSTRQKVQTLLAIYSQEASYPSDVLKMHIENLFSADVDKHISTLQGFYATYSKASFQIQTSKTLDYANGTHSVRYEGKATLVTEGQTGAKVVNFELTVMYDSSQNKLISQRLVFK